MNFSSIIKSFFEDAKSNNLEIYNEFSLQFELSFYLREVLGEEYKIQLERNISFLNLKGDFIKKEIDILIFKDNYNLKEVTIIELKAIIDQKIARPITVFNWITDLKFLEQLKSAGIEKCYSLFVTNNELLLSKPTKSKTKLPLLPDFRNKRVQGSYSTHSKAQKANKTVCLNSEYIFTWQGFVNGQKYFLLDVC